MLFAWIYTSYVIKRVYLDRHPWYYKVADLPPEIENVQK
jgi:hypothetical protein